MVCFSSGSISFHHKARLKAFQFVQPVLHSCGGRASLRRVGIEAAHDGIRRRGDGLPNVLAARRMAGTGRCGRSVCPAHQTHSLGETKGIKWKLDHAIAIFARDQPFHGWSRAATKGPSTRCRKPRAEVTDAYRRFESGTPSQTP